MMEHYIDDKKHSIMKKLLILLFSLLISFNSYGEWVIISTGAEDGATYYIDDETLSERSGYIYFWILKDNVKPDSDGDMSGKGYYEGDCVAKRNRILSNTWYKKNMGMGGYKSYDLGNKWAYPSPDSVGAKLLNYACKNAKKI
mgnify:CR=1 FL=1